MSLRRRFLFLVGLRWLPTGLMVPVLVLFLLERGFTLGQLGVAFAVHAVVVLALELPTGGLADAIGARPVLLAANGAELAALLVFVIVDSVPLLVAAWVLSGVYRALESGPLESWYVNASDGGEEREVELTATLAAAGTVLAIAIAAGSLASGALIAVDPVPGLEPLALPLVMAIGLRAVETGALWLLLDRGPAGDSREPARAEPESSGSPAAAAPRAIALIAEGARLVVRTPALLALLGVELLWGFGMPGFETLFPPRLAEVLDDPTGAAALLGPVSTAAWLCSAAGSAAVPAVASWLGPRVAGALLRAAQGGTVLLLAVLAGPVGLIAAYLATLGVHGASNAIHSTLLHLSADASHRTTVVSANSMAARLGGGAGAVVVGVVAAGSGLTTAMIVAAVVLAAAAPLYLLAGPTGPEDRPPVSSTSGDRAG